MKYLLNSFLGLTLATSVLAIPQNAKAALIRFSATLEQSQEVPTPTPVTGAGGFADVTLDTITNLLSWNISFSGLSGPATAMHFHGPAQPGATAGVQIDIGAISGLNSPSIGSTTLVDDAKGTAAQKKADILAGLWYINTHTELNRPGEIRGQVERVPEPMSLLGLALAGSAGLLVLRKADQN